MAWHATYKKILPYIVRIETQNGFGTGFLFGYNSKGTFAAIATAAHVIDEANGWRQPIKITHHQSGTSIFLTEADRVIFMDENRDSASILISANELPFPKSALPLMDATKFKKVGVELAWVGYPVVVQPELCFFAGRVSAFIEREDCYLIDGVAINGVSGGPVFAEDKADKGLELVGSISSYIYNHIDGKTLPGLMRVQDITSFNDALKNLRTLDDAREKKLEEVRANKGE